MSHSQKNEQRLEEIECPKCGWLYHVELGVIQDQKHEKFVPIECPKCGYEMSERLQGER